MKCQVIKEREFEKRLSRLDPKVRDGVIEKVQEAAKHPQHYLRKLKRFKRRRKIVIGQWRIFVDYSPCTLRCIFVGSHDEYEKKLREWA